MFQISFSSFVLFLVWPYGTYGLPKATSGCPETGGVWGEGYIYQDMEDDTNKSEVSVSFHMEAKFTNSKNINRTFCIKKYPGTFERLWPKGNNTGFRTDFTGFRTDFIISFPRVYN